MYAKHQTAVLRPRPCYDHQRVAPEQVHVTLENDDVDPSAAEKPPIMSADQLRGDFWPDDDPDEFELAVRAWRESDLGRYRR